MVRVGCHVSIRRGYEAAAKIARTLGCSIFQYFPKNPRSLAVKAFDAEDARRCRQFCREHDLLSVAHAPYPVNLAAEDAGLREAIFHSLRNDLAIAEAVGSIGVVVHFGKFAGTDPLKGYRNILQMLNRMLADWDGHALLLLENQAAGPGTSLEEMVQIRSLSDVADRIGFCFDTCHAFASGLWDGTNWPEVADKGRALDWFRHVKVVHLNDSRHPSGSRRDAHANLGRGHIGRDALAPLVRSLAGYGLPFVLETPSSPDITPQTEMMLLKELADD